MTLRVPWLTQPSRYGLLSLCRTRPSLFGTGLTISPIRYSHKFATPPSPNLEKLRQIYTVKLVPLHFYLRNNLHVGSGYIWDEFFIGIMCSPKFEGKTHKEMNQMVEDLAAEVGMSGRVRMICQPPSRWHMMRRRTRKRWDFDR
ncbi:Hypothetical protein SCF082_LOCUS33211 [Durusdinium trenchii]|uniref:Uncharacterized protein n=1 Tax=Durusdinium trenchii TaxID=1381693 RepID=A0ABP0NP39_9DINO